MGLWRNYIGFDALAIDHQMQIRMVSQWEPRTWSGSLQQAAPDRIDDWSAGQHRRACWLRRQPPAGVGVLKQPAVAVITVALSRGAVGDQHVVRQQFDMVERHLPRMIVQRMLRWFTRNSTGISTPS